MVYKKRKLKLLMTKFVSLNVLGIGVKSQNINRGDYKLSKVNMF